MRALALAFLALFGCATVPVSAATPPSFTVDNATVDENAGVVAVTVRKHGSKSNLPSTISYQTVDGSATNDNEYKMAAGQLTFAPAETRKTITVTLINDNDPGPTTTFGMRIRTVSNARLYDANATLTVTDGDLAPPPVPTTKVCPDGMVVLYVEPCPPPPLAFDGVTFPAPVIPSEFDFALGLKTNSGVPKSALPDMNGAFRLICKAGQLNNDDPLVYPGQPGASHLHQFFGNLLANAHSTYESLRKTGRSTCAEGDYPVNRSAYWMPAMLDGTGGVVRPDYVSVYYKRRSADDPYCNPEIEPRAIGKCVELPNGLSFVMGFDYTGRTYVKTGSHYFNCSGPTAIPAHYPDMANVETWCPSTPTNGVYNKLGAIIEAPACWEGKRLASANQRDHVSYVSYINGVKKCPDTHPYVIPAFQMGVWYTVDPTLKTWRLSSDDMVPGAVPGSTFHADFMAAWDEEVKKLWHEHCIRKALNCSGGDLGNGQSIFAAHGSPFKADPRKVPVPPRPAS
ncbi:MAG: DUF1996 domain-containing protein [Pseudomonadota bacterium]